MLITYSLLRIIKIINYRLSFFNKKIKGTALEKIKDLLGNAHNGC